MLLPTPRRVEQLPGSWLAPRSWVIENDCRDFRVEREAKRIIQQTADRIASRRSAGEHTEPGARPGPVTLALRIDETSSVGPQGYHLCAEGGRVTIAARDNAGCFHGLQTLRQLIELADRPIPCLHIVDAPSFQTRGLMHDVTRGKVPRLETLKRLVESIASLKINQLQLYIEHAFVFTFDADICDAEHGLTPDEVRDLNAYAAEHFVTLVPALATLGHMGRVLSLPRYRHLAEIEAPATWENQSWPQRARGLTLDVLNPESMCLVRRLWRDVLDAFSGPVVNICGDEPHDLGRGKNAERLPPTERAAAYRRHIARTVEFVQAAGRRAQMWSDVLVQQADQTDRWSDGLSREITLLHWGYDSAARYEMTRRLIDEGFDTFVCPGTTGWKRVLNAIGLAERNICDFARIGETVGAVGLLNTDWGDHGHFNLLGCSAHGIALGAACGWSGGSERGGANFDRRFARWVLNSQDAGVVETLRACADLADTHETWTLLRTPAAKLVDADGLPSIERLESARRAARRLARWPLPDGLEDALSGHAEMADLKVAAAMAELLAEKLLAVVARSNRFDAVQWRRRLAEVQADYETRWLTCNKAGGLNDIRRALAGA